MTTEMVVDAGADAGVEPFLAEPVRRRSLVAARGVAL
jgi:hypothetical protein